MMCQNLCLNTSELCKGGDQSKYSMFVIHIYICTHPDTPYKSQIVEGYGSNSPYKQLLFVTSRSSWWSSSASLRKLRSTDIVVDDGIFIMYTIMFTLIFIYLFTNIHEMVWIEIPKSSLIWHTMSMLDLNNKLVQRKQKLRIESWR